LQRGLRIGILPLAMARYGAVFLDFDGTFTDVEKEAIPFLAAYRADFTATVGPSVTAGWDRVYALIEANPNAFGWEFDGRIVAPSHADPYIMATSTAQRLLDDHGLYADKVERATLLDGLYRANYPKADNVFRPEAKEVIEALLALNIPLFVVTNSHTEAVQAKIADLAPKGGERLHVYGNAKKYVITDPLVRSAAFDALPESIAVGGLERPIFLRRGRYYDVLVELATKTGIDPADTLIAGDIFELDLALPSALGYSVHLVVRPGTPSYERTAVVRLPNGGLSEDLHAVLDRATA
jgi:FMN phosphatase YigB (HAD superfamily)